MPIDLGGRLDLLVERLRAEPDLLAVYLYGSYGTAAQTTLSDVDLALLFKSGSAPDFDREMRVRGDILETLGEEDVSIMLLERSDPIFQHEVLRTGRLLLCADETALADFVEQVLDRHADFVIDHQRFLVEYDEALRHDASFVRARSPGHAEKRRSDG
jgi:predicted nucleotidyltransferase